MDVAQLIRAAPVKPFTDADALAECIRSASECAQATAICADACLAEANVAKLRLTIRLALDAADLCTVLARFLTRQLDPDLKVVRGLVETSADAIEGCGDECERHAHHDHCRLALEACRRAAEACRDLLAALPAVPEDPPGDGAPAPGGGPTAGGAH